MCIFVPNVLHLQKLLTDQIKCINQMYISFRAANNNLNGTIVEELSGLKSLGK